MRYALVLIALSVGCGARPAAKGPTANETTATEAASIEEEFVVSRSVVHSGESRGKLRVRVVGAKVGPIIRGLAITREAITEDVLSDDDLTLTSWMLDHGHVEGTVTHRADALSEEIVVTYTLTPGPLYTLRSLDVRETTASGKQPALGWAPPLKEGEVFSRAALVKALAAVHRAYHDLGYANVEANADTSIDRDKHNVGVTVTVVRNEIIFFEKVVVAGNKTVATDAIRAKLEVKDGDRYSETAIDKSKAAIEAMGSFDKVNVSVATGSDKTKVVVQFVVEERATK